MIKVKRLNSWATTPTRANPTDAGLDLYAADVITIEPKCKYLVSTAIAVSIPDGYVGYVKPRSGLAVKHAIDVMAGVIDSSYRGEVKVLLINLGNSDFRVSPGDRIAQLVIQKVELWTPVVVDELDDTARGDKGFGSSGN